MLKNIVAFSARNKALVLLLCLVGVIGGAWALKRTPLDALPDVSDVQVILLARWNRPPTVIEDQVAYPLVTAMLGTAKVKAVRASTDYGYSYVYVVFKDGGLVAGREGDDVFEHATSSSREACPCRAWRFPISFPSPRFRRI